MYNESPAITPDVGETEGKPSFLVLVSPYQRQCEASIQNHALQTTTLVVFVIRRPSLSMHTENLNRVFEMM